MQISPATLIAVAFLVFAQAAEAADPPILAPIEAEISALNNKDAEAAGACYTDDGVIIVRPDLPFFGAERTIKGRAEVTQRFKDILAVNFRMEATFRQPEGRRITADVKTWNSVTEKLGVAPTEGTAEYTVQDGRIVTPVLPSATGRAPRARPIARDGRATAPRVQPARGSRILPRRSRSR